MRECRGDHWSPGRKCCIFIEIIGEFVTFTRDDVGIVPYTYFQSPS